MSLAINPDNIFKVMIGGKEYVVVEDSFDLDSYEYVYPAPEGKYSGDADIVHGGGQYGVCAQGFVFKTTSGHTVYGPLTAIEAVFCLTKQ